LSALRTGGRYLQEMFPADGRTDRQIDMTKLRVAFRNFATAPKNLRLLRSFTLILRLG